MLSLATLFLVAVALEFSGAQTSTKERMQMIERELNTICEEDNTDECNGGEECNSANNVELTSK